MCYTYLQASRLTIDAPEQRKGNQGAGKTNMLNNTQAYGRIMKRKLLVFSILVSLAALPVQAAHIDTVLVHSQAMNQDIPTLIITPEGYDTAAAPLPVVYLLHGYSGNYTDWLSKAPVITELADHYQVLIVCPDGGYNSWYLNSPLDPSSQYETHVAREVVDYVDAHYNTVRQANGRAITGLSMGGHGALFLAIRHPDIFGAAGSMSGGVKLTHDIHRWEIALKLGRYEEHPLRWDSLSVVNMADTLRHTALPMIIDCGTDDFFLVVNRELHQTLLDKNIPHDYTERPGSHNWDYWNNAVVYQFLYFCTFFDQQTKTIPSQQQNIP